MNAFAITADTLLAIKSDCYCPRDGIIRTLDSVYLDVLNIKEDTEKYKRKTDLALKRFYPKTEAKEQAKKLDYVYLKVEEMLEYLDIIREVMCLDEDWARELRERFKIDEL
jgi:hypothetical protein